MRNDLKCSPAETCW